MAEKNQDNKKGDHKKPSPDAITVRVLRDVRTPHGVMVREGDTLTGTPNELQADYGLEERHYRDGLKPAAYRIVPR